MLYLTVPSLALIAFNPPRKQPADHTIELFRIYWSDPELSRLLLQIVLASTQFVFLLTAGNSESAKEASYRIL